MSTYALLHGGGDAGWYWHLVEAELRARGHHTVAPDLPADDESATLWTYADFVVDALGDHEDVVVVGQSFGAFTAPLVAARRKVQEIVLVAGMVPKPGEAPADWWTNTGWVESGPADLLEQYYHDVPPELAAEALRRERAHPSERAYSEPWPLEEWPEVPVWFVLCTEDRLFHPDFMRRVVRERLGLAPRELRSGHCSALSRPRELADLLCADVGATS